MGERMRKLGIATVIAMLLVPASPQGARAVQRLVDVWQIPTDTLQDVAVATFVQGRPIIYYNPILLQRFGPRMTEFFFAHEYGHIRFGHTGGALTHDEGELSAVRQRQELEADCYAAALLGEHNREAIEAAVRFFSRMGPYRFDAFHPTGSQRAAKILSCLPSTPEPAEPTSPSPAEVVAGRNVTFTVRSPAASTGEHALEARIWIDDTPVGTVSSLRQPGSVSVQRFSGGAHRYRVAVHLFSFDAMLQLNPSGTARGEGLLTINDGDVFTVRWTAGEPPTLIRQ